MEKWYCWSAVGGAGATFFLFLLDAAAGIVFNGLSPAVDALGMLCCVLLTYLGWNAYADLR